MSFMDNFYLTGKKAIITGGAKGLGFGMTEALCEAGAEVVEVAIEVVDTDDSTLTDGSEAELTAVEILVISDVDAPVDDVPPPQATSNKVAEITKKDSLRLFIY